MAEDQSRKAFETAINFLSICSRSEKEIVDKLYKKGFHRNEVENALEKLKGYKYIDDELYVKTYLSYYGNKYGRKKIAYKLVYDKGVDKQIVEFAIEDILTDDIEKEKAIDFANKYIARKKLLQSGKPKLANWLYGKGFEWKTIYSVLDNVEYFIIEEE